MGSPQRWPARFLTKTSFTRSIPGDDGTPAGQQAIVGSPHGDGRTQRMRSISPAARRSPTHPRTPLTRLKISSMDSPAREGRAGSARVTTRSNTSWWNLTSRRRSRGSSTKSRRRGANAPRRCAWKRRAMEAGRIARFWFRNTISVPGEPPFSAKTNALIYGRLPISVSRLFQTRAAQARRLSRHSVSSRRRLPVSKLERLLSR